LHNTVSYELESGSTTPNLSNPQRGETQIEVYSLSAGETVSFIQTGTIKQ